VAQIPGIGYKTSRSVEHHFGGSFRRMMMATAAEWAEITTTHGGKERRLGLAKATAITDFLRQ